MSATTSNPVLTQLRDTARLLRKPQAVVAANWLRTPAMTTYDEDRNIGLTAEQFTYGMSIVRRLANTLDAPPAFTV